MVFCLCLCVVAFFFGACKSEPEVIKKSFSLEGHHRGAELKVGRISIIFEGLSCEKRNYGSVKIFDSEASDSEPYGLNIQVEVAGRPARDGRPKIGTNYWSGGAGGQRGVIDIGSHEIIFSEKGSLLSINGNEFTIKVGNRYAFLVAEDNKAKVTILPSEG